MIEWDSQLRQEHDDLDAQVKLLEQALAGKNGPQSRWGALSHLVIRSLGPHLELHLRKEEQVLFPALEKIAGGEIEEVRKLIEQHQQLRATLRELADQLSEPRRENINWRQVSESGEKFMRALGEHERQEEHMLKDVLEASLKPRELMKLAEGFHQVTWKAFQEEL